MYKDNISDYKLIILYLLNGLNKPINTIQFEKLISEIEDLDYFYINQYVLDLADDNYISKYTENNNTFIKINETGKQSIELTKDMLSKITRFKLNTALENSKKYIKNTSEAIAEYTLLSETEYAITLKLLENYTTLLELKLLTNSEEQAKYIMDNWKANSNKLYPGIIKMLTEEAIS